MIPNSLLLLSLVSCGSREVLPMAACPEVADQDFHCEVPGYTDRGYDVVLPDGYAAGSPVPVVLALHGGGGNRLSMSRISCDDGTLASTTCLHDLGRTEGFAVVYMDGVSPGGLKKNLRAWTAGGGTDNWRCTGDPTCGMDTDDVAYFRALLDDLESRMSVDTQRVYSTGISNGGAMSHVLACELSDRIAAVAPIGGAMQWTTSRTCTAANPVAVMHVHGTADPCWVYEGGPSECPVGQPGKEHVSVERTMREWAVLLGCTGEAVSEPVEGTTTTRWTWPGCSEDLVLLRVEGGGHVWPDGHQYFKEETVGPVWRDWDDALLWEFLSAHTLD